MASASLFSFSAELNYPVLIALGAMRDLLWRSLIAWPISAVVITCAAFIGLKAAALSWLITVPFQAYISIYFVRRHVDVAWRDIIFSLRKGAALALFSAIGPLSVVVYMDRPLDLSIGATIGIVALGLIGWGAGLRLTMHPLWSEIERVVGKVVGSLLSASKRAQILRR
jgi:O-antigen/teichoic acid export membrane protein